MRRILRLAAVITGTAVVLGVGYLVLFAMLCCRESPRRAVDMVNATDMTVEVFWVGREEFAREVPPGGAIPGGVGEDGCTDLRWVARSPAGEVIARAPEPFCNGDTWVIVDGRLDAGVRVVNATQWPITIKVDRDHLSSVDPGVALLEPGGAGELLVVNYHTRCMTSELIATTPSVGIIDRRPPPFCAGEEWVVSSE